MPDLYMRKEEKTFVHEEGKKNGAIFVHEEGITNRTIFVHEEGITNVPYFWIGQRVLYDKY